MNTTVAELAALVSGQVEGGSGETPITGAAAIADAVEGQITFFGNSKYLPALKCSRATAVLVPLNFSEEFAAIRIKVANPSLAFAQLLEKFAPAPVVHAPGIHPTAIIGENAVLGDDISVEAYVVISSGVQLGKGCVIGAHTFIGQNSKVGENCMIYPHVTLREGSILGNRVIVQPGAVIGSDGFGYEFHEGRHVKIPQIGFVQIDDDVEIGANTTIDRARFGRTWIQEGTKIDNLVQIAHNVTIGKHSIIVSQSGISGSTRLGNYVTLAGQTGLVGHIEIGDQAIVGAKSGVSKNIPPKQHWFGIPAMPADDFKRRFAHVNRLEKLHERVKKLEQILDSIPKSLPPGS